MLVFPTRVTNESFEPILCARSQPLVSPLLRYLAIEGINLVTVSYQTIASLIDSLPLAHRTILV